MNNMKKFFLLTADQLRRLRGDDQARVDNLDDKRLAALHQATRLAKQGAVGPGYVAYREAQARHLSEASKERNQPLAIQEASEAPGTSHGQQDSGVSLQQIAAAVAAELAARTGTPSGTQRRKRKVSDRQQTTRGKRAAKTPRIDPTPLPPSPPPSPQRAPWLKLGQARRASRRLRT